MICQSLICIPALKDLGTNTRLWCSWQLRIKSHLICGHLNIKRYLGNYVWHRMWYEALNAPREPEDSNTYGFTSGTSKWQVNYIGTAYCRCRNMHIYKKKNCCKHSPPAKNFSNCGFTKSQWNSFFILHCPSLYTQASVSVHLVPCLYCGFWHCFLHKGLGCNQPTAPLLWEGTIMSWSKDCHS